MTELREKLEAINGVVSVIQSVDFEKREHYMCVILRNGAALIETTPLGPHFAVQLGRSLERLEDDARHALDYTEALRTSRSGEREIERIERVSPRAVAAVNAVQNKS